MAKLSRWTFAGGLCLSAIALVGGCSRSQTPDGPVPEKRSAGKPVAFLSAYDPKAAAPGAKSQKGIELSPEARLKVGRGPDYVPVADLGNGQALFDRLEKSMADRRSTAWQVVEKLLAPQKLELDGKTYDIPLWHTWYEGSASLTGIPANDEASKLITAFIGALGECKANPKCEDTPAKREELAGNVVSEFGTKSMAASLTTANLTRALGQLADKSGKVAATSVQSDHLGTGFTLFSPSFMTHLLSQAQGVEQCLDADKAKKAADSPPSTTQFSYCVSEFPRSAVMVKASWSEIDNTKPLAAQSDTSGPTLEKQLKVDGGRWPRPQAALGTTDNMYSVQASDGKFYGLNAIHFSTKDTREWLWITLWWDPKPASDFGADRPASLANYNGGVWANYKMCVTSSFEEKDSAPWASYEKDEPSLAAAIKGSYNAISAQKALPPFDMVTTWCSNPNVETHFNNDKTNCIGCHQYSLSLSENPKIFGLKEGDFTYNDFADTILLTRDRKLLPAAFKAAYMPFYPQLGRARFRKNFAGDFAWSSLFEFNSQISDAREEAGFKW